jgi:predicted phage terminase large subunit-like protein
MDDNDDHPGKLHPEQRIKGGNVGPDGVPRPLPQKPEGDKISRLAGVSAMIEAGQLLLPEVAPWLAEFRSELLGFPNSRHDDQVNALSQLLAHVWQWESGQGWM